MAYTNGYAPENRMVELDRGYDRFGFWKHLAPPGTAARWKWMVKTGKSKYGVTLDITDGWNVYRPYRIQVVYRNELGIYAAYPGSSSHGGKFWWNGKYIDFMAIDVFNWKDLAPGNERLAWSRFVALCKAAGFVTNFVTPTELWHIGDPNPWVLPTGLDPKPLPIPEEEDENPRKDDDMGFFAVTRSAKLTEFFVYSISDAQKISHAEAVALNASYGYTDGKKTLFNRISANSAGILLDGVRYRRQRMYDAISNQTADQVSKDLDGMIADLKAQAVAEGDDPNSVE